MSAVIDKPPFWRTALSLFKGFDGWLALAILLLMGIGLTAMYSSGFDHGTRFVDHGRNMLLAWGIILTVAMVPQQRLQQLALPLYTLAGLVLARSGAAQRLSALFVALFGGGTRGTVIAASGEWSKSVGTEVMYSKFGAIEVRYDDTAKLATASSGRSVIAAQ